MSDEDEEAVRSAFEPELADLADQIIGRLMAGEPISPSDWADVKPACAGPIRRLLPTMQAMVSFGSRAARDKIVHSDMADSETKPADSS